MSEEVITLPGVYSWEVLMRQKAASWRPSKNNARWSRVAPHVVAMVVAAEPPTTRRISELMGALAKLAMFVEAEAGRRAEEARETRRAHDAKLGGKASRSAGGGKSGTRTGDDDDATVKSDPSMWLSIETIEWFIKHGLPGATIETRGTYLRYLMQLRAAVVGENGGKRIKLSASNTHRPYTKAEQKEMWYWAHNQRTPRREAACKVLLGLGLGCGLDSSEICQVRAHDVRLPAGNGAVVVHVRGRRPRIVQCRRAWEGELARLAADLSGQAAWLFQPTVEQRSTALVSRLLSSVRKAPDAPAVKVGRMRDTWLVDLIENRVALTTIAAAAGLDSLDALSPLLPFLASAEADEAERQLRGLEP